MYINASQSSNFVSQWNIFTYIYTLYILYLYIYLHDPNDAANKSLYALFQHNPVISSFFAFSNENFHKGKSVPSVSRNSSEASSQYLKSKEQHNWKNDSCNINEHHNWCRYKRHYWVQSAYLVQCRCKYFDWSYAQQS